MACIARESDHEPEPGELRLDPFQTEPPAATGPPSSHADGTHTAGNDEFVLDQLFNQHPNSGRTRPR
jgi:hypothetical protein